MVGKLNTREAQAALAVGLGFAVLMWLLVAPKFGMASQQTVGQLALPDEVNQLDRRLEDRVVPTSFEVQVAPALPVAPVAPLPKTLPSKVTLYRTILVEEPGCGYGKTRKQSHYLTPIAKRRDGLNGRSRKWGDASLAVQAAMIDRVVERLGEAGYSRRQIAFALALIRCESGFNPDAAAGYSSAAGLVQMVDKTRVALSQRAGVSPSDPFCYEANTECLVYAMEEMFQFAAKRAPVMSARYFELAYAYHHDGPELSKGGREIAREKVLPWISQCEEVCSR